MTTRGLPLRDRFNLYVFPEPNSGCFLWTGAVDPHGYGAITVNGITAKAHRLSYEFNYGAIPSDMSVLHKCDVRCCVNPNHLFLGTRADNLQDMRNKNRHFKKLSNSDILKICKDSRSHREIAKEYGVVKSTIGNAKRRAAFDAGKPFA